MPHEPLSQRKADPIPPLSPCSNPPQWLRQLEALQQSQGSPRVEVSPGRGLTLQQLILAAASSAARDSSSHSSAAAALQQQGPGSNPGTAAERQSRLANVSSCSTGGSLGGASGGMGSMQARAKRSSSMGRILAEASASQGSRPKPRAVSSFARAAEITQAAAQAAAFAQLRAAAVSAAAEAALRNASLGGGLLQPQGSGGAGAGGDAGGAGPGAAAHPGLLTASGSGSRRGSRASTSVRFSPETYAAGGSVGGEARGSSGIGFAGAGGSSGGPSHPSVLGMLRGRLRMQSSTNERGSMDVALDSDLVNTAPGNVLAQLDEHGSSGAQDLVEGRCVAVDSSFCFVRCIVLLLCVCACFLCPAAHEQHCAACTSDVRGGIHAAGKDLRALRLCCALAAPSAQPSRMLLWCACRSKSMTAMGRRLNKFRSLTERYKLGGTGGSSRGSQDGSAPHSPGAGGLDAGPSGASHSSAGSHATMSDRSTAASGPGLKSKTPKRQSSLRKLASGIKRVFSGREHRVSGIPFTSMGQVPDDFAQQVDHELAQAQAQMQQQETRGVRSPTRVMILGDSRVQPTMAPGPYSSPGPRSGGSSTPGILRRDAAGSGRMEVTLSHLPKVPASSGEESEGEDSGTPSGVVLPGGHGSADDRSPERGVGENRRDEEEAAGSS